MSRIYISVTLLTLSIASLSLAIEPRRTSVVPMQTIQKLKEQPNIQLELRSPATAFYSEIRKVEIPVERHTIDDQGVITKWEDEKNQTEFLEKIGKYRTILERKEVAGVGLLPLTLEAFCAASDTDIKAMIHINISANGDILLERMGPGNDHFIRMRKSSEPFRKIEGICKNFESMSIDEMGQAVHDIRAALDLTEENLKSIATRVANNKTDKTKTRVEGPFRSLKTIEQAVK